MSNAGRILVVDDDRALTDLLSELLQTEGFDCRVAHNGNDALVLEAAQKPDLVILDVMMPGDDGVSTLRTLRKTSQVPVLMLTAMGEEDDRILGLEAGADDYLAKPFAARELVLRIQSILRRTVEPLPTGKDVPVEAGPLTIYMNKSRAELDGESLSLTGAELRILEALAASAGEVVSRDRLTEIALGRELSPYDRALDTHVSHLRRKLREKDPGVALEIRSVRGAGYQLVVD